MNVSFHGDSFHLLPSRVMERSDLYVSLKWGGSQICVDRCNADAAAAFLNVADITRFLLDSRCSTLLPTWPVDEDDIEEGEASFAGESVDIGGRGVDSAEGQAFVV